MEAREICKDLYWVGVFDTELRVFDIVMNTPYGTTYNAYLLRGTDGVAVFETAKEQFSAEYIRHIKTILKPDEKIKYIVLNHTEPDHSGSLDALMEEYPDATVVATAVAHNNIANIAHKFASKMKKVNATASLELSLGNYTLKFIPSPMIHWPDTMMTYVPELKTLIPCDFFGAHYCNKNLFNDEILAKNPEEEPKMWDAYQYYFNAIMGPFKSFVIAALNKIKDLDIQIVCCSHGPVLRSNLQAYADKYREWSAEPKRENVVVIAYASAYGYTAAMAQAIKKGVESKGYAVRLVDLIPQTPADALKDINAVKGLLLGTPTLIGDAIPPVWQITMGLNPVIHKGLVCGTFGSFGWSGEGCKNIQERFKQLKFKTPLEPMICKFKPTVEILAKCEEWGAKFVESL